MKLIVAIALVLAVVGFINGQTAQPKAVQNCAVPSASSIATAFCSASLTYPLTGGVFDSTKDVAASANYNATVAGLTSISATCTTALKAYYCQYNFPRCGPYVNYTSIAVARCSAVTTACNITSFPGAFVGSQCINNTLLTIDNPAVCIPTATSGLSQQCNNGAGFFNPTIVPPATVQFTTCPVVSGCNAGSSGVGTCVSPNNIGDSCNSTCTAATGLPTTGSALTCIGGRCTYGSKRAGASCVANGECASSNCTAGTCFEQSLYGPCTNNFQCRVGLYCDSFNSTCYTVANNNEPCGQLQVNWAPVPCAAGFTCVRSNPNATATCQANAELGGACATQTAAVVYNAPICSPTTLLQTGSAQCLNNVCTQVSPATQGQACNSTITCATSLTCQWTSAAGGTCQIPSSVACDTTGQGANCNTNQVCNCGTGLNTQGTCAIDTTNPAATCDLAKRALTLCITTKCRSTPAYYPYDGTSCVDQQCRTLINAYFCCVKTNAGASFVPLTGQPADPCVTPTPSPTPSTTTVPKKSSSKSGAATIAVSFFAAIIAVVAFCL